MGMRLRSFFLGMLLCLMGSLFTNQFLPAWSENAAPQKRPALYEFGARTCAASIQMAKVMEELKASHGDKVDFHLVYVDEEKDMSRHYRITIVPTQVFLDASGKEVGRHVGGLTSEEVLKKIQALGFIQ